MHWLSVGAWGVGHSIKLRGKADFGGFQAWKGLGPSHAECLLRTVADCCRAMVRGGCHLAMGKSVDTVTLRGHLPSPFRIGCPDLVRKPAIVSLLD